MSGKPQNEQIQTEQTHYNIPELQNIQKN